MPPVTVPTYQQAYGSLGSIYDPQTQLVNSQLADLPNQEQTTLSSLDQAKVNAFRDITDSANAKGMLFSGFSPDQQARYIGEKYLPSVAAAKTATINARTSLLGKLNDINANRATQAIGLVNTATSNAIKASKAAQPKPLTQQETMAAIRTGLNGVRGSDGFVAPQDYATAYKDWVTAGYDPTKFDTYFGDLMNPHNGYYQYAKSQVR